MALTLWSWEAGGPRLGISDSGPGQVLDLAEVDRGWFTLEALWDRLCCLDRMGRITWLRELLSANPQRVNIGAYAHRFPAPVSEVWAAGVTYERSRDARTEETEGAEAFYRKVYTAERPEIFYKGSGPRLAAPGAEMGLRRDATWHVPEPELGVLLDPRGEVFGFTVANDLSSRDLEGANPLYLPQAKLFHKSGALGPSVALEGTLDPYALAIRLEVVRQGATVYVGEVSTAKMRRTIEELVNCLRREWEVLPWTALMTGTGIVPPTTFALEDRDLMAISIEGIGTLSNRARRIGPDWAHVLG